MAGTIPKLTKTLIVVILDESGSMQVQKRDVIGGYNSFVESQRQIAEDEGRLILIKFNQVISVAHSATALSEVPELNEGNFRPSGSTALYDAVADGIRIAEGAVQKDERVLVLIMTDGEENASKKSNSTEVKGMITEKENLGNWTFAYIGENPDGWTKAMGQSNRPNANAVPYDMHMQSSNFRLASAATSAFRSAPMQQQVAGFYPVAAAPKKQ